ncbi:MAG: DUF1559 domain-containing protein, partial [Gemmataceae bacterium]|nr:DUF1559 domain-containing protein [Gemmataceae bacterium]
GAVTVPSGTTQAVWAGSSYAPNLTVFATPCGGNFLGRDCLVSWNASVRINTVGDGTSNTIMFAERYIQPSTLFNLWAYPSNYYWPYNGYFVAVGNAVRLPQVGAPASAASWFRTNTAHPSSINVLLMDGSVRGVSGSVSPKTWHDAHTANGGEVLGADW